MKLRFKHDFTFYRGLSDFLTCKIREENMRNFGAASFIICTTLVVATGMYALIAFLLEFCWNNVMPAIFHLPEIGWFQAFCLLMIAHLLVKTNVNTSQKNKND